MSPNTKAISDDIIAAAKQSADALITRMCVTMDHSFGLQDEQQQRGLRTSMTQLAEHDIAPAIAKAIHDAVMAERERNRWQPIETAPRDGTDILVADDGRQGVEMVSWKGGAKKGGWHTEDRVASYTADFFTHWQPLPAAPKSEG